MNLRSVEFSGANENSLNWNRLLLIIKTDKKRTESRQSNEKLKKLTFVNGLPHVISSFSDISGWFLTAPPELPDIENSRITDRNNTAEMTAVVYFIGVAGLSCTLKSTSRSNDAESDVSSKRATLAFQSGEILMPFTFLNTEEFWPSKISLSWSVTDFTWNDSPWLPFIWTFTPW